MWLLKNSTLQNVIFEMKNFRIGIHSFDIFDIYKLHVN